MSESPIGSRYAERAAALLLGVALVVLAGIPAIVLSWFGSAAAQEPNPFIADGMLCCGHPDTWWAVARDAVLTGVIAVPIAFVAMLAVGCLWWAATGRFWGWKVSARFAAGGGALVAVLIGGTAVAQAGSAVTPPACDAFVFDRRTWDAGAGLRADYVGEFGAARGQTASVRAAEVQLLGVATCDLLDGKDEAGVRDALGTPDSRERQDSTDPWYWWYGPMIVQFAPGGRVDEVRVVSPDRPDW